jgi:hypothetical protein
MHLFVYYYVETDSECVTSALIQKQSNLSNSLNRSSIECQVLDIHKAYKVKIIHSSSTW